MSNNPTNPSDHEEVDPFADLDESVPELSAEGMADMADMADFNSDPQPTDTAEFLDADESAPASAASTTSTKKKPKSVVRLALLSASAFVVAIIGWLGWSYWVDREALATLQSDLMNARDQAESANGNPTDAGEIATASQLAGRVATINDAPWWDRVAVRFIDQHSLETATAEAAELGQSAQRRKANRNWYAQQVSTIDDALAIDDRTIPVMQGLLDDLQASQAPNPNDGGYTDELTAQTGTRVQSDIAQLVQAQDEAIGLLKELQALIEASPSLDDLASASASLSKPLPIDRNPPELSEAMSNIREQAKLVEFLLIARDTLHTDLRGALDELNATDVETASLETLTNNRDQLAALPISIDARFDQSRQLAQECMQSADAIIEVLTARDAAMAWIDQRSSELDQIDSLDQIANFAQGISNDAAPQSELSVVANALQNLATRIGQRAQELAETQRLLEESMARAAVCGEQLDAVTHWITLGKMASAADGIVALNPETDDQISAVANLKNQFAILLLNQLTAMADHAKVDGEWSNIAGEIRQCLASASVLTLVPQFQTEAVELWTTVKTAEDRMLYEQIQQLANGSYAQLSPIAVWYLDPTRTKGEAAVMQAEVAALMSALEVPGVTIQVEGIEWTDLNCDWVEPRTIVDVTIDQEPHHFELGQLSALETTLLSTTLGNDQVLKMHRANPVAISIRGNMMCSNNDGSFSGDGVLTMDDLRTGGRFALPFWSDGDQTKPAHKLLLVSIPDSEIVIASKLPDWSDPRIAQQQDTSVRDASDAPATPMVDIEDPPASADSGQDPPSHEVPRGL